MTKTATRNVTIIVTLSLAAALAGCGGEEDPTPPVWDPQAQTEKPYEEGPANTEPMSCEEACEWGVVHGCTPSSIDCDAFCQKSARLTAAAGCEGTFQALSACLGQHVDQLTCQSAGVCAPEGQAHGACMSAYCMKNPTDPDCGTSKSPPPAPKP